MSQIWEIQATMIWEMHATDLGDMGHRDLGDACHKFGRYGPHELDKIQKNSRNTLFWVRILMIIIGTNHHFPLWYGMHFTSFGLCRQDTTQVEFVVDVTLKWEIQAPGHKMCRPYLPFRVRHQKGRYAPRKWSLVEIMHWYWYATLWENDGWKTILWPPKERVQINRYGTY